MKYAIKNIKSFIKNEKMIFMLVLLCVVTSSFIINFAYGIYQNYSLTKGEIKSEYLSFSVYFKNTEKAYASKEKIKSTLLTFPDEINNSIDMYLVGVIYEEYAGTELNRIDVHFCIKDGEIIPSEIYKNNSTKNGILRNGRYFSEQEEKNGERVALINCKPMSNEIGQYIKDIMIDDETILFQGDKYKIIGYMTLETLVIPFECVKDNMPVYEVLFYFKKPVTLSQYNEIKRIIKKNFGSIARVPGFDIPETDNLYLYNTIILISLLVSVLAAINFAFLYRYILSKRVRALAVFRICGCTKEEVLGVFLKECMMIAVPAFAITTLFYDRLVLPELGKHFEYIQSVYSPERYLLISAIYMITTLIVLLIMINSEFLNKKIIEVKGE